MSYPVIGIPEPVVQDGLNPVSSKLLLSGEAIQLEHQPFIGIFFGVEQGTPLRSHIAQDTIVIQYHSSVEGGAHLRIADYGFNRG